MSETARASQPESEQLHGDAGAVATRVVAIDYIHQIQGYFERFPVPFAQDHVYASAVPGAHAEMTDDTHVVVVVEMGCELTVGRREGDQVDENEAKPESAPDRRLVARIEGKFIIGYVLSEGPRPDDRDLEAFADANGVFTATPYWREYVSSSLVRTGLPPIMAPVRKVSK